MIDLEKQKRYLNLLELMFDELCQHDFPLPSGPCRFVKDVTALFGEPRQLQAGITAYIMHDKHNDKKKAIDVIEKTNQTMLRLAFNWNDPSAAERDLVAILHMIPAVLNNSEIISEFTGHSSFHIGSGDACFDMIGNRLARCSDYAIHFIDRC